MTVLLNIFNAFFVVNHNDFPSYKEFFFAKEIKRNYTKLTLQNL